MCRTAASRSTASSSASNKLLNYSRRETRGFLKMKGECMDILTVLEERFENNTLRHPGLDWQTASQKLQKNPDILKAACAMEESGGEPDLVVFPDGSCVLCDCSKETPAGRRSLCYDREARLKRRKAPCETSAEEEAQTMGIQIMDEAMYRYLQTLGEFDLKTSSWIRTPDSIRSKGGALFCERRYDAVFTFHNGAESYYSVRGFRGYYPL